MAGKLTPARLKEIQAKIRPGLFLASFAKRLEDDAEDILNALFAIAKGNTQQMQDGSWVVRGDPKDTLAAIKVIMDMGAFKDVVKHLLKVAQKGRPDADPDHEDWIDEYADIEVDDAPAPRKKAPPKKGA